MGGWMDIHLLLYDSKITKQIELKIWFDKAHMLSQVNGIHIIANKQSLV